MDICEASEAPAALAAVVAQLQSKARGPVTIEAQASALHAIADTAVRRLCERLHALGGFGSDAPPSGEIERATSELRYFNRLVARFEGAMA